MWPASEFLVERLQFGYKTNVGEVVTIKIAIL